MVVVRIVLAPPLIPPPEGDDITLTFEEEEDCNIKALEEDDEMLRFQLYSLIDIPPPFIQVTLPQSSSSKQHFQDGDCIIVTLNLPWQSQCSRIFSLPDQALHQPHAATLIRNNAPICAGCASTCHPPTHLRLTTHHSSHFDDLQQQDTFICQCGNEDGSSCLFKDRFGSQVVPLTQLNAILDHAIQKRITLEQINPNAGGNSGNNGNNGHNSANNQIQMARRIHSYMKQVTQYENPTNQEKARNLIPHERLWKAVTSQTNETDNIIHNTMPPDITHYPDCITNSKQERILLQELLNWFKHEFFTWTNQPPCTSCHNVQHMKPAPPSPPLPEELAYGAQRVEIYQCTNPSCNNTITRFPRYNSASRLLDPDTRRGRCGEWANAFTLLLRSMGYPARFVVDWTDHVWTEVWLTHEQRWCHMDSCEASLDSPLLYEAGWGKKLNYTIAFSVQDGITDVIWRYTRKWEDVLSRRTIVSETFLDAFIQSTSLLKTYHAYLRNELETREIQAWKLDMKKHISPEEEQGRTSGAITWRRARGELGNHHDPPPPPSASKHTNSSSETQNEDKLHPIPNKKPNVEQTKINDTTALTKEEVSHLTRLYFQRLTEGCSRVNQCQNPNLCGTCKGNPNKAAIVALKMAMAGDRSQLC